MGPEATSLQQCRDNLIRRVSGAWTACEILDRRDRRCAALSPTSTKPAHALVAYCAPCSSRWSRFSLWLRDSSPPATSSRRCSSAGSASCFRWSSSSSVVVVGDERGAEPLGLGAQLVHGFGAHDAVGAPEGPEPMMMRLRTSSLMRRPARARRSGPRCGTGSRRGWDGPLRCLGRRGPRAPSPRTVWPESTGTRLRSPS